MEFLSLITKLFLLLSLSTQFLIRTICFAIQTGFDFLRTVVFIHLVLFWRIAVFPIALMSLPIRAFAALNRERMMEMQVQKMKKALENALWDRKELKEQLKTMKTMLTELEDEHGEAILQIELLVREVEELKDEIWRLKEVGGNKNSGAEMSSMYNDRSHFQANTGDIISCCAEDVLAWQRRAALSGSVFSATLSVVVGIVVWEAKDPCVPLVMALVAVVSMSLISVVRFLSTFQHKPARVAVGLLSLNWFLLGTLVYPTFAKTSVC